MEIDYKEFFSTREHYTIPCLFYGKSYDFSLEYLYQALKARLMDELAQDSRGKHK